ncbi:MAG: tRNA preQ1(34) S-adenosylmethionine ribosyltransferase-isomerase QueA [Acholeplasmatales bacterium]|nr:MAG: tRNA preQ1(34) S-adenosylmethionine ribosyltransferase-isomerase QueA [Acholeplasmatales bacterium]
MKLEDFHYDLPEACIAQRPLENRGDSRLLVVDRETGDLNDAQFRDLARYLKVGDVLVINDSAVIPARLIGEKADTRATVEMLLLRQIETNLWECLLKKAKKVRVGTKLIFGNGLLEAVCTAEKPDGIRWMRLIHAGLFYPLLERLGEMPLPPYIHEKLDQPERYQTVYSKHRGSSAAPTAGLHFTTDHLEALKAAGIICVAITLHVGLGTFRPVTVKDVTTHKMHEEMYTVSAESATIINKAKEEGRRIVAVGTTSMRTLETVQKDGRVVAGSGMSQLFIYPGFDFQVVDALLTNFHLPASTLLMLVSAFSSRDIIMKAYQHAIASNYRFFSFGDAMFLTR